MSKVIHKTATTANDNKISQLTTGELAIVTNSTGPRVAFKDENDRVIYLTPVDDIEFAIWNSGEEPGSVNLNGFKFNKTDEDIIRLIGDFSYPSAAASNGGTLTPTNTLKLVKNGIPQTVTFTYSSNQSYATVDTATGKVTFTPHTNTSPRTATITAKCVYNDREYPQPAVATQSAYVAPTYALSGTFSYSGNVAASGGTKAPTNTLGITKNGVAVSGVTITYSSNQSYATVDSTGKVTFTAHTSTSTRTATITATVACTDENGTHTFTKTANITQSAYVPDVIVIDGSFSYGGNVAYNGGTATISSNTLKLKKNGTDLSGIVFTYKINGNPSYATINSSTGAVTFQNNTGALRSINVVAECTYNGDPYTSSNVSVSQNAYVAPVETLYTYVGWVKTSAGVPVEINDFVSKKETVSTTKTINVTVDEIVNTIVVLCPSTMSLTLCESQTLKEDISSIMDMTTVTYNGKQYKMYQHRFGTSLKGNEFKIIFN